MSTAPAASRDTPARYGAPPRLTDQPPPGFAFLEDEPVFDPVRHLALEKPERIYQLDELGYSDEEIARSPSTLAITDIFRFLTEEGAAALLEVTRALQRTATSSARIPKMVRGSIYKSRFIRDLSQSPEVTAFLSELAGTPLAPHSVPLHQGHINYAPEDLEKAVDRWHWDTTAFDYVLLPSDPAGLKGGRFTWFKGHRDEGVRLIEAHGEIDEADPRRIEVEFPAAGYAVFQQGSLVLHRATRLQERAERTTVVNSYIALDPLYDDVSRLDDLRKVDPPEVLYTEWTRHKAWLARNRLDHLLDTLPFTEDRTLLIERLRHASRDIEDAIRDLSSEGGQGLYFGNR